MQEQFNQSKEEINVKHEFGVGVSLQARVVFGLLSIIIILLTLISVAASFFRYNLALESYNYINILLTLFSLDREQNIPTYFSSFQLLISALLLTYVYVLKLQTNNANRTYWGVLAFLFLLLSVEEYVGLHELTSDPLKEYIDLGSWFYFTWVIPAFVFALICGLYFLKFLIKLPSVTRKRFIIAGLMYVIGSLGFEILGGRLTSTIGVNNFLYAITANIEEMLEMFAIAYFIFALLKYVQLNNQQGLHIFLH